MSQKDLNRIFAEAIKMAKNAPGATSKDTCYFLKRSKQLVTRKDKVLGFLAQL